MCIPQGKTQLQKSVANIPLYATTDISFVDPVTKLELLPKPKLLYRERTNKKQRAISFFESNDDWLPLAQHSLIYAEHLRRTDPGLYGALNAQAREESTRFSELLFSLGVMTKEYISNPPKGYKRQADLLKAVRKYLRSVSLARSADIALGTCKQR